MRIVTLIVMLALSTQSHALVLNGIDYSLDICKGHPMDCTIATTTSLPTMIVNDATGEEVWNSANEELLAEYKNELNGSSPIYAIKRYAEIKTGGDITAAIGEIKQNLEILEKQKH
ncbi:MAG: hypothetical protein ACXVCP_16920 [Bdellovibrio sp.]